MTGGEQGYFGYEYQIQATAFLLLQYINVYSFDRIEVETAFGNDAALISKEQTPSNDESILSLAMQMDSLSSLQIQIKTRGTNKPWQPNDICNILLKNDETSNSSSENTVIDRLISNPNEKFLFLTDGTVSTDLSNLLVHIENLKPIKKNPNYNQVIKRLKSSKRNKPSKIDNLNENVIKRFIIIDRLSLDYINLKIENLLSNKYKVPVSLLKDKKEKFIKKIRDAILPNRTTNIISSKDITDIIGETNILPFQNIKDTFFISTSFNKASSILDKHNIVIIIGEPGVGKTTIAQALANDLSEKQYIIKYSKDSNVHLEIFQSYNTDQECFFYLDDIFGDITFEQNKSAFFNNFDQIIDFLKNKNNRIKVIITSRYNVFSHAKSSSKLKNYDLSDIIINIPPPSINLKNKIFSSINKFKNINLEKITSIIDINNFENLLHIKQFSISLEKKNYLEPEEINRSFEETRPSAYAEWIDKQSKYCKLILYSLSIIISNNQFADYDNLEKIFTILIEDKIIQPEDISNLYQESLKHLIEREQRVFVEKNNSITFIHSQLREAIENHFLNNNNFKKQTLINITKLLDSKDPRLETIAAMLCTNYYNKLGEPKELLYTLFSSHYLSTIETIIKFSNENIIKILTASQVDSYNPKTYRLFYEPYDIYEDEMGFICIKKDNSSSIENIHLFLSNNKNHDISDFERIIEDGLVDSLKPTDIFQFSNYLKYKLNDYNNKKLHEIIYSISIHLFSFVRIQSISFLKYLKNANIEIYNNIFKALSYDKHPQVRIELLKKFIMPNWPIQNNETKEEWQNIVFDMLDDAIIRNNISMGLIDASERYEFYQNGYNQNDIFLWKIKSISKILEHNIINHSYFENIIDVFLDNIKNIDNNTKNSILRKIINYQEQNTEGIISLLEEIMSNKNITYYEIKYIKTLLKQKNPFYNGKIYHILCKNINKELKINIKLKKYINNILKEENNHFLIEKSCIIIGYLNNNKIESHDLPLEITNKNNTTVNTTKNEAIFNYINKQNDEFKMMIILTILGYRELHLIRCQSVDLYISDTIQYFLKYFTKLPTLNESIFVVHAIIIDAYYLLQNSEDEYLLQQWYNQLNLFIYSDNIDLCKKTCDLIFASNISSSVHNLLDYQKIVFLFLNHPNDEVRSHAYYLFDEHFTTFWNTLQELIHIAKYNDILKKTWFSDEFFNNLKLNSQEFPKWLNSFNTFDDIYNLWDEMPDDCWIICLNYFKYAAITNNYTIINRADIFLRELEKKLSPDKISLLKDIIYDEEVFTGDLIEQNINGRSFIRKVLKGRNKQLSKDASLRNLFPTMDWTKYSSQ